MIKTIKKLGNSKGVIFDAALLEMAHLAEGDKLSVTVHDGGAIMFTPIRDTISPKKGAAVTRQIIFNNKELFDRLSK